MQTNDSLHAQAHVGGDRSRALRRIALYTPTLALLALLQTTLLHHVLPFGALPDLGVLFVMGVAMFDGANVGGITGLGAGFLCAACGETGISLLPLLFFVVGYGVGRLGGRALARTFPSYMVFAIALCIIRPLFTLAQLGLIAGAAAFDLPLMLRHGYVPELVANLIAAVIMYLPMRRVVKKARRVG